MSPTEHQQSSLKKTSELLKGDRVTVTAEVSLYPHEKPRGRVVGPGRRPGTCIVRLVGAKHSRVIMSRYLTKITP